MGLTGIDHVQLAMPPGGEDAARSFYGAVLGIPAATARTRLHRGRELLERAIAQLPASREARKSTVDELEAWIGRIRGSLRLSSV